MILKITSLTLTVADENKGTRKAAALNRVSQLLSHSRFMILPAMFVRDRDCDRDCDVDR
jgi:hypothetical protein